MRNGRVLRAWVFLGLATVLTTAAAAVASPVGQLYAEIYPGDVVITDTESFDRALADATVVTDFEDDVLTVNESSRFTAIVIYATEEPPTGIDVEVAFRNDATLTVTAGQADVSADSPTRQNLGQGHPWPGGGFALEWHWDVVPRTTGMLKVEFEIQPVLFFIGGSSTEGAKVNEPTEIAVDVHPNQLAFDEIVAAAETDLEVTIPSLSAGGPAEVTASLPLTGHEDVVRAAIALATGPESAPATIEELSSPATPGPGEPLVATWLVTPAEDGVVKLVFTVAITASAGDVPLSDTVVTARTAAADPSFWDSAQRLVVAATSILALVAAVFAVKKDLFGLRTWLRRRRPGKATAPVDSEP